MVIDINLPSNPAKPVGHPPVPGLLGERRDSLHVFQPQELMVTCPDTDRHRQHNMSLAEWAERKKGTRNGNVVSLLESKKTWQR